MANENLGASFSIDVTDLKAGLAQANRLIRESESEFREAAAGMDDWTKSQEGLEARQKILNKQIDLQSEKVNALTAEKKRIISEMEKEGKSAEEISKATEKVNDSITKESKQLDKLKGELNKTEKALDNFGDESDTAGKKVEEFADNSKDAGEKALSLGDIIKANLISEAIIGGVSALANGFKAVGSAIGDCLANGAAYADNLLTLSAQTGLSTDTLEKYNAIAELADVSVETFTGSLAKTTKAMGEAQKGSTKYVEAYKKLGVSVTDANGNLRDSEDVYWETVDALKGIENETERDALAMELFGKKAQDLNTIIEMGSDGFKELEQTAVDMGAVLGGEGLAALGALDDQMQIFKSTTGATGNILASAFAPMVGEAMKEVNEFGGALNGLIASVLSGDEGGIEAAMISLSEEVGDMVSAIGDMIPQMMDIATKLISALIDTIIADIPWIAEQGAEMLSSLLSGITQNLAKIFPVVLSVIQTLLNTILKNLPMVLQMGIQMIVALIDGIAEALPGIVSTVMSVLPVLINSLISSIPQLLQAAVTLLMALVDAIPIIIVSLVEALPSIIQTLITALISSIPILLNASIQLLMALVKSIPVIIDALTVALPQIIDTLITGLTDAIPLLLEGSIQLLMALVDAIPVILDALIVNLPTIIDTIITGVLDALPLLLDAAITLFFAIIDAIPTIVETLYSRMPQIIEAILGSISKAIPKLFSTAKQLLGKIGDAIGNLVKELPGKMGQVITSMVKGLKNGIKKIKDIGGDIIKGLWDGIKDMTSWIGDKIKGFGESVLGGIKSFFGIKSPSRVMADQVGKNLALGIGKGFTDNIGEVNREIQSAFNLKPVPVQFSANGVAGGLASASMGGVVVNQYNNYSQAHSRYEIWQSQANTAAAVKLALIGG